MTSLALVDEEKLVPPKSTFANPSQGASDGENDGNGISHHSRTISNNTSLLETPPVTPRNNITFSTHASLPSQSDIADFSRRSSLYFSSRPGTSDTSRRETFSLPRTRTLVMYSSVQPSSVKIERERPKSTLLTSSTAIEKPWLTVRVPHQRISYALTYGVMVLGILLGGVRVWFGWNDVEVLKGNLCMVMDENFDSDANVFGENGKFFREVEMSGFGNGQFEMTTASESNSYVKNGYLYITPTLTSDVIGEASVIDGYVYNITGCTYNTTKGISYTSSKQSSWSDAFDAAAYTKACSAVSNVTTGQVINPVQSARLSTRKSASIQYGRVEVRAKIPTGDWLWPAIWMLPVNDTYGPWPMSGEIDIMEARGNGPSYPKQGSDYVRGSLNWGPLTWLNSGWKTFGWWSLRRGSYDQGFHTYVLEWDQDFIRIYVDTPLHHLLDLKIKKSFFERGGFPPVVQNASDSLVLENPWVNGTMVAPFDQPFYLILNVAVGGTNGWFPNGDEKPWLDGSATPMLDFWRTKNHWFPTWPKDTEARSMVIDYVKMWQKC